MKIEVHLHAILQIQTPEGLINKIQVDLPLNSSINDLINSLDIPFEADTLLIAVNHRTAAPDQILNNEDVVNLMPPISGGL